MENPQSLLDEFALVAPGQVTEPDGSHGVVRRPGRSAELDRQHTCRPPPRSRSRTRSTPRRSRSPPWSSACCSSPSSRSAASRSSRSGASARSGCSSRPARRTATSVSSSAPTARSSVSSVRSSASSSGSSSGSPTVRVSSRARTTSSAVLALSWTVVAAAMVLAVVAAYFAASRPARAITKVPIVQALSGRPAPPRQIHRSALPGIVFLVAAFLLLGYSGGTNHGNGSGGAPELLFGIVLLIPGLILLAPFFLSLTARLGAACADRDPPRAARSGPLSGALGLGARGDQPRGARRGDRDARRRVPLRQRPRLRRPEPLLEPARPPRQPAAARPARSCTATPKVSSFRSRTSRWRPPLPPSLPPAPSRSRRASARSSSPSRRRMRD